MILVDFSGLIIAGAMTQKKPVVDEGMLRHNCINTLLSVKKRFGAKYGEMVICCDSNNYWRKDIYPHYKGNRVESKEESTFDWKLFYTYLEKIKAEIKEVFPYRLLEINRLEADDIIGTLALTAKEDTVIYSRDQDFIQCLSNPRVKLWLANEKKLYEKLKPYEAEWHLFEKVCQGDRGDFIPNIFSNITDLELGIKQKSCTAKNVELLYKSDTDPLWTETLKKRFEENSKLISLKLVPDNYKEQIKEAFELPVIGSRGKIFGYLTNKKLNALGGHFISDLGSF